MAARCWTRLWAPAGGEPVIVHAERKVRIDGRSIIFIPNMRWCATTTAASPAASASGSAPTRCTAMTKRAERHAERRVANASTATAACRLCPTRALKIVKTDHTFKENANWTRRHHQGDLPPGRNRRRAALLHGQPQALPRVLGPDAHQRLPGHQPLHRPPAGAHGDPGLSGQKARPNPRGTQTGNICTDTCRPSWSWQCPSCSPP